jgi:hypothetical protein
MARSTRGISGVDPQASQRWLMAGSTPGVPRACLGMSHERSGGVQAGRT